MQIPRLLSRFMFLVLLQATLCAQEDPGRVKLPTETYSAAYDALLARAQFENMEAPAWKAFKKTYGEWSAYWNATTHVPMRVWGEGYQMPGVTKITEGNVEEVSRTFLRAVSDLLRTDVEQLRFVNANQYLGKWAVSFLQQHKGIPVLFSDVEVRISDAGKVFLFGSEFQPQLDVDVVPTIGLEQAQADAVSGLDLQRQGNLLVEEGSLVILPVKSVRGINHHLTYECTVRQDDLHIWKTWVDAHSGEVIWRYNQVLEGISGQVTSNVKPSSYSGSYQIMPNAWQYVTVNSANVTTDASGNFTSSNSGSVVMKFQGPYCKISRQDGVDATVTQTVANNGTYNFFWSDANSVPAERTAFWSVNYARNYIVTMDPVITGLNYQVLTRVNMSSTCNANFDGTNLNFYRSGTVSGQGTCPNAAEMPDVVMHEYGHLVNSKVYIQFGKTSGMQNGALHEGLADANAAMILDRPEMGVGFWGPNTVLRLLDNNNRYPQNIVNESHTDGLIIGGACWDMRLRIGVTLAGRLIQFARHAKADDSNTGIAFTKFFLEILVADDNDANLANGTPHSVDIVPAFAKHGIPSGMLSISHTKVSDKTANTIIPVNCSVTSQLSSITTQTVKLYYRQIHGSWTTVNLSMSSGTPGGTSQWTGSIPAQSGGSIMEYYLEASEAWGSSVTAPSGGATAPYRFLVGYLTQTFFDFESTAGWQGHIPGDGAMTGRWINADPIGTFVNTSTPVQTEDDHTATGVKCWVTANGTVNGQPGEADVDDGQTTLLSPTINALNLGAPVIRYWRWFSNDLGAAPGGDPWVVQISSDDGVTWTDVENTTTSFNRWEENLILVSDYVTPSSQMRMRFIARDDDPQSLVEAAVDDFEILYTTTVPVQLVSFTASWEDRTIQVRWATESETNNSGFAIEYRSPAESDWHTAGFVAGHGTIQRHSSYAFSFDVSERETKFVRLRQIDFDGSETLSPVVEVGVTQEEFHLGRSFPHPASERAYLTLDLPEARNIAVTLTNAVGAEVIKQSFDILPAGRHYLMLKVGALPSGIYFYRVQGGASMGTGTMLIAH